jgi:hypothetical protein
VCRKRVLLFGLGWAEYIDSAGSDFGDPNHNPLPSTPAPETYETHTRLYGRYTTPPHRPVPPHRLYTTLNTTQRVSGTQHDITPQAAPHPPQALW